MSDTLTSTEQTLMSAVGEYVVLCNEYKAQVQEQYEKNYQLFSENAELRSDRQAMLQEISRLEAKKDQLELEIDMLQGTIHQLDCRFDQLRESADRLISLNSFYEGCLEHIPLWVQHVFGVDHRLPPGTRPPKGTGAPRVPDDEIMFS